MKSLSELDNTEEGGGGVRELWDPFVVLSEGSGCGVRGRIKSAEV